ncbi:hypothetical protein SEVIR_3G401900v4 [Setaria viridis]|uniref:Tyrosinase copper-binding domain-containing protein n=1 Tax=Setaria viridis TaxID=4556 RepID=A0A4U6VL40_SETVI|nr:hypothetical protein SEVIR_3G401900v2 [Setaria viridis]
MHALPVTNHRRRHRPGDDPYLLSCSDAPLSQGGDGGAASSNKTARARWPIVTDQRCATRELPPLALPPFHCCPPPSPSEPIPFAFPDPATTPLRTRRPAHAAAGDADHVAKYARAVALKKALPPLDPRSFHQQANIHCAYCTGAHRQAGRSDLGVEVHFSWLFFPFHRAYLYFFERIAAKLLGDPGFALPFWAWDVPEGMRIPDAFADEASPLYDAMREPAHAPPKLGDLDFSWGEEKNLTDDQQVLLNLRLMYKQMVSGARLPALFLGQPYRAGDEAMPGPGKLEWAPHNTMHVWTGDQSLFNVEDMGVYYSAGRDPIFYARNAHHANIDRLWEAWRRDIVGAGSGRGPDLDDPDMLDGDRLRYTYNAGADDDRPQPWLDPAARPPATPGVNPEGGRRLGSVVSFHVSLDAPVTAEVRRPPRARRGGGGAACWRRVSRRRRRRCWWWRASSQTPGSSSGSTCT